MNVQAMVMLRVTYTIDGSANPSVTLVMPDQLRDVIGAQILKA